MHAPAHSCSVHEARASRLFTAIKNVFLSLFAVDRCLHLVSYVEYSITYTVSVISKIDINIARY